MQLLIVIETLCSFQACRRSNNTKKSLKGGKLEKGIFRELVAELSGQTFIQNKRQERGSQLPAAGGRLVLEDVQFKGYCGMIEQKKDHVYWQTPKVKSIG
jgi:hypothetical protein